MITFPIRRLALMALVVLLGAGACTMTANVDDATPVPTIDAFATMTAMPTQQFIIPTATPLPTTTFTPVPTVINCTPYTAWPAYKVVAGDTLGVIATLTNTTTAALVTANCLTNPDAIYVGQVLYVPVLPPTALPKPTATSTATVNPNMPVFQQALTANQHWIRADGLAVTYYSSVRVTVGVVTNATLVNFYVNDPGSGSAIYIGQDADPWDGAFVDYVFPAQGQYTFLAKAENEAMRVNSSPFTVIYDPSYTPPGQTQYNALVFTPTISAGGDGWIHLRRNTTVTITWPDAPVGADIVKFTLAPTGTGMTPEEFASDLNPADGALVTWVATGSSMHIQAVATMPGGTVISSQIMSVIAE